MTAFQDYVSTELPTRIAIQAAPTEDYYLRATGIARLVEERSPVQVRGDIAAASEDGDILDITWNPSFYTPDTTPSEVTNVDELTAHLYGIDQVFDALRTVIYVPDAVATSVGEPTGSVSDIQTLDDGNEYLVDEVSGTPGYSIEVDFVGVTEMPTRLDIYGNYDGLNHHVVEVQIRIPAGAWVSLGTLPPGIAEYEYYTFPIVNGGQYVSGGAVETRILHTSSGNPSDNIHLDYVALVKTSGLSGGGGVTDHLYLSHVGGNTHAQIDTHIDDSNAHHAESHKDSHDPQDGSDALDTFAAANITGITAGGTGNAHTLARSNHVHGISHSIADNRLATIDGTVNQPVADDYARFTADGLEGRSFAEVLSDIGAFAHDGSIAATGDWNLDGHDLIGINHLRSQADSDTHIDLVSTANQIRIHPGADAGYRYLKIASSAANSSYPMLLPNVANSGQLGTSSFPFSQCHVDGLFAKSIRITDNFGTGDHDLLMVSNEIMTASRQLSFDLNDANRTLTLTGNATLDQDVSSTGSPQFDSLNLADYLDLAGGGSILATGGGHLTLAPDGNVLVNSASVVITTGNIQLTNTAAAAIQHTVNSDTTSHTAQLNFRRAKAGPANLTAVNSLVARWNFQPYVNGGYTNRARFEAKVTGAISGVTCPTSMLFYTGSTGITLRFGIDPDGNFDFHGGDLVDVGDVGCGGIEATGNFACNGKSSIIPPNYTVTNVAADRVLDADAVTLDELADIVGTMIKDLRLTGLFTG